MLSEESSNILVKQGIGNYARLPIQIAVRGTYHQLGTFVSGVASLPRIVTVHNIHIKLSGKTGDELTMTAIAQTYRALDEDEGS